jgi:hypothetical protein
MLKRLFVFALMLSSSLAYSKTVSSVAISPQGAVLVAGTNLQYSALCTYSDGTTDNCAAAGGATWSTPTTAMSVNSTGLASWNAGYDPHNATLFPQGIQTALGLVRVSAGGQSDVGQLLAQSTGDTFYIYMTPDPGFYNDIQTNAVLPINVVVGSTVTMGAGFTSSSQSSGNPFQMTCNWSSSNNAVATVSRYGMATAVSPGSVTITCGSAGNGKYATASGTGTTFTFNVVAPTPTSQTWYVRPNGGTPFVSNSQTPSGQCDGKHDADYPGTGVNQPCAMGNLRYLWTDQVSHDKEQWMIGPGDTVIVRQKTTGYNLGMDALSPTNGGTTGYQPVNCGVSDCYMPSIPSGTASQHTRILGENYASCHVDSAKTKVLVSWGSKNGINVRDSQFVDVQCLEITDDAACAYNGSYKNNCPKNVSYGQTGILQSALTASVTYTDLLIHGLSSEGIHGATGAGVVANYVHIRGTPTAGIDFDDAPHNLSNISVAGGFTLNNSITEFAGCVEEYPIVHNYPYIECRDSETGGYGDGFGTASTTGDWSFDHDIWRYNFQDGLDLLHAGLQNLTITNSQAYGNDGNQFKVGSADHVIFQNNTAVANCERIGQVIGDEPASAIVPGVNLCRAGGGPVVLQFSAYGTYAVQDNSMAGYADTALAFACSSGSDNCSAATTTLQNNVLLMYSDSSFNGSQTSATFCALDPSKDDCNNFLSNYPANQGWATRSNNIYYNTRSCPKTLTAGESCNTKNPLFANQPASPISPATEITMDNYNFVPSVSSPLIGAGIGIPGLLIDLAGLLRPNPPSIGALEYAAGTALSPAAVTLTATPNPATAGQSVTLTATIAMVGSVEPTGTVTFSSNGTSIGSAVLNSSGVATLSLSTLATGSDSITVTYSGDSKYAAGASNATTVTINGAAKTASTTSLTASPNPATTAQAITLTSTVTATSGTPTGTVTFFDGSASLGTGTLNGAGVASLQVASMTAASHTLTAQYSGNTTLNASTSAAVVETVTAAAGAATTTSLTASPNPATTAQAITLTATVTTASGTPTGTVTFFDGATSLGSATLTGSGIASFSAPAMTAGSHNLSAHYAGNTTFNASVSATVAETVNAPAPSSTTTSLIASPNPATTAQAVTLTATVTAASGAPTGTITFFDGATSLGSATANGSGAASLAIPSLTAGIHNLTAHYSGNTTLNASTSSNFAEVVNAPAAATTTTTLVASPNPAITNQSVTLTATVTASSGKATGTVTFLDGGTSVGSGTVNTSGVVTVQLSSLSAGIHHLTAQYAGATGFNASASPVVTEIVNAPALIQTTTLLQVSASQIVVGQPVTLTATVAATSGISTGTVTFLDGSTPLGTATIVSGIATIQVPSLAVGSHSLTAQYAGNGTFGASASSGVAVAVSASSLPQTTTVFEISQNPSPAGMSVTLTATVSSASGTPSGTVSFLNGGVAFGSATLNGSGVATYTAQSLPAGTYSLAAQYAGSSAYNASTSNNVSWTIVASGVTLALSTPSLTVPSGVASSNPVTLTLTPFGGYTGTLQMACQSPTPTASCSFQPQTVTVSQNSGPTNVTMVVQTAPTVAFAAPHDRQPSQPGQSLVFSASILWIPGILAAALVGAKRKLLPKSAHLLLLLLLCGIFGAITGCGAGNIDPLGISSNTTAIKIMVTGTGNVSQSTILNITSK